MVKLTRRQFVKLTGATAAGLALLGAGCSAPVASERRQVTAPTGDQAYLSVARGSDPAAITQAALAAVGGIERFVHSGDDVIIKPNICVNYHGPEYAATTNPTVVATLVTLCLGAGAQRVRVMDMPFSGTPESAYAISGIADAVHAAGGVMEVMSAVKFVEAAIPEGRDLTAWTVYQDILDADVLINVPIAKDHSAARLSLGCKNLLGTIDRPNLMHTNLGQRIADITSLVRPSLTVVDAVRILIDHGPTGGSLNDVQLANTIIASHDIVAADAYAATLFDVQAGQVPFLSAAADMGLGTIDLDGIDIEDVVV